MWSYVNLDGVDCKSQLNDTQIQENNHFTNVIQSIPFFQNTIIQFPVEMLGTWSSNCVMAIVTKNNIKYYIKKCPVLEVGNYIALKILNAYNINTPNVLFYFTNDNEIQCLYISRDAEIIIKEIKKENKQIDKITYKYESVQFLRPEKFLPSWYNKRDNVINNFEIKHAIRRFILYTLFSIEDASILNNIFFLNKNKKYKTITFDINLFIKHFNLKHSFNPLEDNFWNYFTKFNMSYKYQFFGNESKMKNENRNDIIYSTILLNYFYKNIKFDDDNEESKHCLDDDQKYIILHALQKLLFLKEDFKKNINKLFNEDVFITSLKCNHNNYLAELLEIYLKHKEFLLQKDCNLEILKNQVELERLKISNLPHLITNNINAFCDQLDEETKQWNKIHIRKQIPSYEEQTKIKKKNKLNENNKEYINKVLINNNDVFDIDVMLIPEKFIFDFKNFKETYSASKYLKN